MIRFTATDDAENGRAQTPSQKRFDALVERTFDDRDWYLIEIFVDGVWHNVGENYGSHNDACIATNEYAEKFDVQARWNFTKEPA